MFVCETLQETNIDVHGVVTWAHNSAQWRDNVWNSKGHNAAKQEYGMDANEIQAAVNELGTKTIIQIIAAEKWRNTPPGKPLSSLATYLFSYF